MVLNRGLALQKLFRTTQKLQGGVLQQSIRHSGGEWVYRTLNVPRKRNIIMAEVVAGATWYWILYHLLSEPGHIFGEYPFPDPEKWTDEELGIPPDDE